MIFDFILKPVGSKCNLSCSYCYYLQNYDNKFNNSIWSINDARLIINKIADFEKSRNNKHARVTWHGGEPLLAGKNFYEQVSKFQKETGIEFSNSIQTNGTLIDNNWIEIFKSLKTSVGISIDGPAFINDKQRYTKDGKSVFDKVLRSINLCLDNDLRVGILCVITETSSQFSTELLNFFLDNNIKNFDFLPAYNCGENKNIFSISPKNFAEFMKKILDWYLDYDDPEIKIRTIVSIIERFLGGTGGVCTISGKSCGSFLTVEGNGDISFCDDYNADILPNLGNIKTDNLTQIINSELFNQCRNIALSRVSNNVNCKKCDVNVICNGGCQRNWVGESNYFCEYYREFFTYVFKILESELEGNLIRE
ncbi:MAG: hypothetical protein CVU40_17240 [Chloroflexi bacterium HGW-Chloroflexi-2]|jgi:uncharacterized protein|nr:MAG: hypothetical protein CVU40_17240 [Chloroflexi bacterium HGW-Chloroflexi-2]